MWLFVAIINLLCRFVLVGLYCLCILTFIGIHIVPEAIIIIGCCLLLGIVHTCIHVCPLSIVIISHL